jgi:hypothetical protein
MTGLLSNFVVHDLKALERATLGRDPGTWFCSITVRENGEIIRLLSGAGGTGTVLPVLL